ncbi:5'-methylthioadenosine/adenosylhomocysteine nucleosidase [uncultured Polaribacter sp.]|uniref:5'-methylthioadenosine/adenosylhomocysteine nucleosidase n=1 Tax=uncultured Polaribacter sp. TaxID=174711 RepID=UPI0026346ACE|nr:5'-methylthioadenosine/adenosylhomocysteine nucleosidase [uncultured Polaribacter sp.]
MTIGIISAMPEEVQTLVEALEDVSITNKGMRSYYAGTFRSHQLVVVFSRWGKVAAAATTTQLINDYAIDEIIFTGVAGALDSNLKVGDVVIGSKLFQHDMDTRPLFKRFEIPLLNKTSFSTTTNIKLEKAVHDFTNSIHNYVESKDLQEFSIDNLTIHKGVVLSGDQFIADAKKVNELKTALPNALCVEMEGAAVAQVCFEYDVPFSIIRIISDNANDDAPIDFPKFTKSIASNYAKGILENYSI